MNPYSTLGLDTTTQGYLAQAGVNPSANFQATPQVAPPGLSAYPTYPNAAGVGSQTAGGTNTITPSASTNTQTAPQVGVASTIPDASARGLSPYSLLGDANYRAK